MWRGKTTVRCRILSDFLSEVEETVREKYDDMSELEHQKQFIMMLNSINYLRTVLSEWSDQVVCSACIFTEERCMAASIPHDKYGRGGLIQVFILDYASQCLTLNPSLRAASWATNIMTMFLHSSSWRCTTRCMRRNVRQLPTTTGKA